jgi:tRNA nucleotidyltransferase (CCA-adding enzyme)
VDVGKVLAELGGGGHASAASAVVRRGDAAMVLADVEAILRRDPPRPTRVLELMSSPVRTVTADTLLGEVAESLASWRHTGVPVKKDGKLVGIISRRDVEKAERAGRLGLPVASCMSQHLKTTTPEQSLSQALAQMQSEDVGRLPVMRGDNLVGIITRSDVLRALYGDKD